MRRSLATACFALACAAGALGCSQTDSDEATGAQPRELPGAQARPPAPAASAALTQIADGAAARRRLAYVNLVRVAEVKPAVAPRAVLRQVLGRAALPRLPARGARSAVQVGPATVVRGPGLRDLAGAPAARRSGGDGLVFGGDAGLRAALADPQPEVSSIAPAAQSAVQSCLGDAAAQTILGPAVMGRDAAIGVGLRASQDPPAGVQLAICFAPHLRRDLHRAQRRAERRFAALPVPRARRAVIGELEIGERDMLSVVLPADAVGERRLLALLSGSQALRALGGRG